MRLLIHQGEASTEVELADGRVRVGGSAEDELRLEGLAAAVLVLEIEGDRLTATAAEVVEVDGALLPPRVPRLLLPGERLALPDGTALELPPQAASAREGQATLAVLRELATQDLAPAATRAATLTCLTGLDTGKVFALEDEVELGRGEQVGLRIRDRSVSRRHARIHREPVTADAPFWLEDLGSPNGVFLNGARVREPRALARGDVVELGHCMLRFDDAADPPPAPAPPEPSAAAPEEDVPAEAETEESQTRAPPRFERAEWALLGLGSGLTLAALVTGWLLS